MAKKIIYASIALTVVFMLARCSGFSEKRARDSMQIFIDDNNLQIKRATCAGDSDGDGYGSCTVVTKEGEKIHLQCPTNILQTSIFGNTGCKEVDVRVAGSSRSVIPAL